MGVAVFISALRHIWSTCFFNGSSVDFISEQVVSPLAGQFLLEVLACDPISVNVQMVWVGQMLPAYYISVCRPFVLDLDTLSSSNVLDCRFCLTQNVRCLGKSIRVVSVRF